MRIARLLRHLLMPRWGVRLRFPARSLRAIEAAIRACEVTHSGELRFAVESALPWHALWHNRSARERAIEVFARLRVWDTAHNNGVLIYLLLAERDVEIVADRGLQPHVTPQQWEQICRAMEDAFRQGRFEQGVLAGIEAIGALLAQHYPASGADRNELPDWPVLL